MGKNACIVKRLALGVGLAVVTLMTLGVLSFVLFTSLHHHLAETSPGLAATANTADLQRAAFEAILSDARLILAGTLLCGILIASAAAWTITQGLADTARELSGAPQQQNAGGVEMTAANESPGPSIGAAKKSGIEAVPRAGEPAEPGGTAGEKPIAALNLIEASSVQVSQITQAISEIAGQTDLLAQTAAIEAARTGEQGMGFAVAADEVRGLAEYSNRAAGKMSALIEESSKRVAEGLPLSAETGRAFCEILSGVEATAHRIAEIAEATLDRAATVRKVASSIHGIADAADQAAMGSRQAAAGSEQLRAQAAALRDLVNQFRTDGAPLKGVS